MKRPQVYYSIVIFGFDSCPGSRQVHYLIEKYMTSREPLIVLFSHGRLLNKIVNLLIIYPDQKVPARFTYHLHTHNRPILLVGGIEIPAPFTKCDTTQYFCYSAADDITHINPVLSSIMYF